MTAISDDAATELEPSELDEDSAAEELLKRYLPPDAKQPSEKAKDESKTETEPKTETEEEPSAEEPEEKSKDEAEGDEAEGESETVIKIKVGDEEHEVPASKLARLYGQEASLTKKSMEVAEQRKTAEKDLATNTAATQALLARANQRYEPYAKLDFNLLAAQVGREGGLTTEEYQGLRQSAQSAYEDVQFLSKHLNDFMGAMQQRQQETVRERALECIKVLSDPKTGIEGWDQKLYDDIRSYAVAQGAPADVINSLVEPWAFKTLHAAMLYERGKTKGKVVTKKSNNTPKKIVKTTESPATSQSNDNSKSKKALERAAYTGTQDDAAEALLARWTERQQAGE
jgi:hypothetical protein